ncbi:MAG: glycosyltransferase family 4 protein [Sedimentisphaerales bacterium]|nr:glycosyltransferase family 4 protein [Sedimentisphaerales bacterium]
MADKKRLVIVSGSFPKISCGVSGHVELVARLTAERGDYDVHVLTSDDPLVDETIAQGYEVHKRIKCWSMGRALSIVKQILALEPDIVHLQNQTIKYYGWGGLTMSLVAPLLKLRARGVRLVVMQHDVAIGREWLRWRYWPLFVSADAIFVSNSRDEQAIAAQGIGRKKIYRCPVSSHFSMEPSDAAGRAAARGELGIAEDEKCWAYFGYVHPGRNIDVLVRATAALADRGVKVRGVIMGGAFAGMQRYYDDCKALAERLGVGDCLTWTGYADERQIAMGLAAADVFVSLPERGADMRNTSILTAMLAGVPIVTMENRRYYVDKDLRQYGCRCVAGATVAQVAKALAEVWDLPRDEQMLARRAKFLERGRIWNLHIDEHYRAYRGEGPSAPMRFEG